jgi:hypothetical protein
VLVLLLLLLFLFVHIWQRLGSPWPNSDQTYLKWDIQYHQACTSFSKHQFKRFNGSLFFVKIYSFVKIFYSCCYCYWTSKLGCLKESLSPFVNPEWNGKRRRLKDLHSIVVETKNGQILTLSPLSTSRPQEIHAFWEDGSCRTN